MRFSFPRQSHGDFYCLSDFARPAEAGRASDVLALMAVTVGHEVTKVAKEWYDAGNYKDYLYLHGLGVESAEALALILRAPRTSWLAERAALFWT